MQSHRNAEAARHLARMMIRQSRMLRDEGLVAEARELARRAVALDRLGWTGRVGEAPVGA